MPKTKNSIKTIPYRNTFMKNKDFVLDKKVTYKQNGWIKPRGFWYQINDCAKNRHTSDYKYIYKVDIDLSNIFVIKNYQDYLKFNKKYSMLKTYKYSESVKESNVSNSDPLIEKRLHINWEKVSKKYSGIEVKNYKKIIVQLRKDELETNVDSWLEYLFFSRGCIWDLKAVKSVNYCCKFSKQLQLNSKLISRKSNRKSSSKSKRAVKKSSSKKTKKKN
jgi:hypothetical protein